jgi:dihydroflavonol-4-reductase
MSQKTAFVTGATGFVGAAVARALLQEGWHLRLLARKGSDRRNLEGLHAEIIEGDYTAPTAFEDKLRGIDALFHVAADYRIWVPDRAAMIETNVAGSLALCKTALATGVGRIVYTSSVAALGCYGDGRSGTEQTPPAKLDDMIGTYKRSKFLAEQAIREWATVTKADVVIVNPSTPIGPRDIKPTPTGRMIVEAMRGRMPAYVDTGLNVVHVDDVAIGHLRAYEKGRRGEGYILGGTNLGFGEILAIIATEAGRRPPNVKIPRGPLFPLAYAAEAIGYLTGREPFVTVDALRMAKKKMFFSCDKAKAELGYSPRPALDAIKDAMTWFETHGYGL